jgi:hypothetical protein
MSDSHENKPAEAEAAAAGKEASGLKTKLAVLGFVAGVIVVECAAAFFFLGSGQPADAAVTEDWDPVAAVDEGHGHGHGSDEAEAHGGHGDSHGGGHGAASEGQGEHGATPLPKRAAGGHGGGHGGGHADEIMEVELGEFSIMGPTAHSDRSLIVDCLVYGMVESAASHEFTALFEAKKVRIRDQIIVIIRSAEGNDLAEPTLAVIKRRILVRINETLGKPLLKGVVFSRFSFMEQ